MKKRAKGRVLSQRGMTVIELLTAMFIMAILMGIATMGFQRMQVKADIDSQAKELYADLMKVRSEALFRKESRSVVVTGTSAITVYASSDGSGDPLWSKSYTKNKVIDSNNTDPLAFDASGVAVAEKCYCVGGAGNEAGVDSIAIKSTSLALGKLDGGACSSANINPK